MLASILFVSVLHPAGGETITLKVDGVDRTAIVFRRSVSAKAKPAVYFVFHGHGGTAQLATRQFHIQELDPNAIVIYAQGLPSEGARRPGDGKSGWQIGPGQNLDRDVHFVQSMIKWAEENGADSSKRYFIGHSNGSAFAWVVLKEIGDQFTRFVGMNGGTILPLRGAPAKPALLMTGSNDRIVRPQSVRRFADSLAEHNGCKAGFGSPVKVYVGPNPIYLYEYDGGHMPPNDAYEKAVKFCQTGRV